MTGKMMRLGICLALVLCVQVAAGALPAADDPEGILSPYFLLEGSGSGGDDFPLKSTVVKAEVDGVIADVTVTQVYANEGNAPLHARYVFPGSTRASVHGLRLTVGNRTVVAKIQERQEARKTFEAAKTAGKSASLLEEHRPNVFGMSVANILPGDRVEVELRYSELLVPEEGTYRFVYPTVVGPRYSHEPEAAAAPALAWAKSPILRQGEDPGTRFDIRVTLSTGIPLQEVHCSSHAVNVDWQSQSVARVSLADASDFGGNRDFVLSYRLAGREIQSGLLLYKGDDENFFLLMVQPPERIRPADIPPREYLFVVDVSGSMQGFPLETSKALIRDLLGRLRETDLFNVILFSGDSRVLSPASLESTAANVQEAMGLIEQETGGGGTELLPALKTALALPRRDGFARTVVVITDGYIEADRQVFDLVHDSLGRASFFSFGIGGSVNRYLVEGIARAGLGEPFVVTEPAQAPDAAARFRTYIEAPLLTGIQVAARGFDTYDVEPQSVPDLFAGRPVVLFGKWRGDAAGELEVSGRDAKGTYARTFQVSDVKPLPENAALRYLWARTRIARLSDFSFGEEDPDTAKQITALGLRYSLLTRHTSFVAVLEQVRNPDGGGKEVDQPLPLPQGVSDMAVGGSFGMGAEPGLPLLLALLALILALAFLRRRLRPAAGP